MGETKRINHAIALARDAIYAANLRKEGCTIADLDFKAAFNLLGMEWVYEVLKKKGLDPRAIERLYRYYKNKLGARTLGARSCHLRFTPKERS